MATIRLTSRLPDSDHSHCLLRFMYIARLMLTYLKLMASEILALVHFSMVKGGVNPLARSSLCEISDQAFFFGTRGKSLMEIRASSVPYSVYTLSQQPSRFASLHESFQCDNLKR